MCRYDRKRSTGPLPQTEQPSERTCPQEHKIFGVELPDKDSYPEAIDKLLHFLFTNAAKRVDIFRKSPDSLLLKELAADLDSGKEVSFAKHDVHTVAALLKLYVRQLPTPLIPPASYANLDRLQSASDRQEFARTHFPVQSALLKRLLVFLKQTADHCSVNKMPAKSLAVIWAPNLIRHDDPEEDMRRIKAAHMLVELLIKQQP